MIDLENMTHEQLATEARDVARREHNDHLADLARKLQTACDNEEPSNEIAREILNILNG